MILRLLLIAKTHHRRPRASGDDPRLTEIRLMLPGVDPARAGMIPMRSRFSELTFSRPRASGDDPGDKGETGLPGA